MSLLDRLVGCIMFIVLVIMILYQNHLIKQQEHMITILETNIINQNNQDLSEVLAKLDTALKKEPPQPVQTPVKVTQPVNKVKPKPRKHKKGKYICLPPKLLKNHLDAKDGEVEQLKTVVNILDSRVKTAHDIIDRQRFEIEQWNKLNTLLKQENEALEKEQRNVQQKKNKTKFLLWQNQTSYKGKCTRRNQVT